MSSNEPEKRHAALWLIGPDMLGLLNLGAKYISERGGNIDKDIADKFGEKAVVFMSVTAPPKNIEKMDRDKEDLKRASGCGVVFQAMSEPTVPAGFLEELYGFDVVTDDAIGVIAALTELLTSFGVLIVGHSGERRVIPGPRREVKAGQKYVIMLPHEFDHAAFNYQLTELIKKYNGTMQTPLRPVPGLLWWW